MGLFDQFPYTNFHELNLAWILEALKEIQTTTEQFVAINSLKYADPIQWNITSQYEKNTIVIDPQSGTAYISVQAVPIGVALTNEDYWTVVFDLEQFVTKANSNFTSRVEEATTTTATFATPQGSLVIWGGELYVANTNIIAGDQYVVGSNITRIHVEDITGRLLDLTTTDKSNLVAAINELVTNLANEITARENADTNLQTNIDDEATARENADTNLQTNIDDEASTRASADSTLQSNIGNLNNLNTTAKSNLVDAINEISNRGTIYSLSNRAFILIGDSYGSGYDGSSDTNRGWLYQCKDLLEDGGATVYTNAGASGAGFAVSGNKWLTALNTILNSLTTAEKESITDLVVLGGTNDTANNNVTYAELSSAIEQFFTAFKAACPNAKMKCGIVSAVLTYVCGNSAETWKAYSECVNYGCEFITDGALLLANPDYISSDGTHLTLAGYNKLCPYLYDLIVSGHCSYAFEPRINITSYLSSSVSVSNGSSLYLTVRYNQNQLEYLLKTENNDGAILSASTVGTGSFNVLTNLPKVIPFTNRYIAILFGDVFQNSSLVAQLQIYAGNIAGIDDATTTTITMAVGNGASTSAGTTYMTFKPLFVPLLQRYGRT